MTTPETEADPERFEAPEEFPCPNCGATLKWDPAADALTCEYCEHVVQVPREERTILERPLSEAGAAARGLGVEHRVSKCGNCAAAVAFDASSTSELCVYCGSPNVLAQEANRNALRPESLIPLDVERERVRANFRKWIRGLWFRPSALKELKRFEAVGVYVPFWTFDCRVHSDWHAMAGHYYTVMVPTTVMVNGKPTVQMRPEQRIRWEPAWGQRDDAYDDLLVNASTGVPEKLVSKLGRWDTSALVPYRPEYLAGWRAEEYAVDLAGGWERGQHRVVAAQRELCAGDVPGDTYTGLRVQNEISDVRWKHVLLPLWSVQYRFGGEVYTVLVHGQTGRVVGDAPYSWVKILLAVLAVIVIGMVALLAAALSQ
jgi:DNA-directed RNA polymerase subunit RPC12/RpoP